MTVRHASPSLRWQKRVDPRVCLVRQPHHPAQQAYRNLQDALTQTHAQQHAGVVAVASAEPESGRSLTAANLALSLARISGHVPVLIEADFSRPTLVRRLNTPARPGLAELLTGRAELEDTLRRVDRTGLWAMPAGRVSTDEGHALLTDPVFPRLIQALRGVYEHVVIDTPCLVEREAAEAIVGLADAVVLTARVERTTRPALTEASKRLKQIGANVVGVVATDAG